MSRSRFASFGQYLGISVFIGKFINKLVRHQVGITGGINAYLCQHLVNDNLNMFVVYIHALGAVHLLYLVNQVLLDSFFTQYAQYVVRVNGTVGQLLTGFHLVTGLDPDTGTRREDILPLFFLGIAYSQLLLLYSDLAGKASQYRLGFRRWGGLRFRSFGGGFSGKYRAYVDPLSVLYHDLQIAG